LVDLDRFKQINDLWGHGVGDECLRRISERLLSCTRGHDAVGRLGGDEFLIVCQDVVSEEQAVAIAERVAEATREVIDVGTVRINLRASIGVVWTNGGMDSDGLVAAADAAMYDSKREGLGRPILTQPVMGKLLS
jgi:diguanylate cyclase (GGDEF)-like protein